MTRLFAECKPTVVFHVAAYKHVPMMESQPEEAINTNVLGTLNVCRAAQQAGCERLIFISTDKAVDPANVMGATKLMCERIVQTFAAGDGPDLLLGTFRQCAEQPRQRRADIYPPD